MLSPTNNSRIPNVKGPYLASLQPIRRRYDTVELIESGLDGKEKSKSETSEKNWKKRGKINPIPSFFESA